MVEAFRSLGVEAVPGPGNLFDPEVHEAIMREEKDDVPDGTVLKEFRRGFKLGSQLLRAAMVQVCSQICIGTFMCNRTQFLSSHTVRGSLSACSARWSLIAPVHGLPEQDAGAEI
jgi:hypothetical protein